MESKRALRIILRKLDSIMQAGGVMILARPLAFSCDINDVATFAHTLTRAEVTHWCPLFCALGQGLHVVAKFHKTKLSENHTLR